VTRREALRGETAVAELGQDIGPDRLEARGLHATPYGDLGAVAPRAKRQRREIEYMRRHTLRDVAVRACEELIAVGGSRSE
jgi:hypothetical protein